MSTPQRPGDPIRGVGSNQHEDKPPTTTSASAAATATGRAAGAAADNDPFAAAEPDTQQWGQVDIKQGARTPWGPADIVTNPADGIAVVHTPGHGGIKLSPERNASVPPALRKKSGWYEEDCEALIVGMTHPEAFPHVNDAHAYAEAGVKDWFPDQYEQAFGVTIPPEESHQKRENAKRADAAAFRAEHANEYVTHQPGDSHAPWVPDGYCVMPARMDATGEERSFLVPKDEAIDNNRYRSNLVINPNTHLDVTDVVNAKPDETSPHRKQEGPKITGDAIGINYDGLTANQAATAKAELKQLYRFSNDDGTTTTETMAEHFARVGVVGKAVNNYGNKTGISYVVEFGDSRILEVKKATFEALGGVPDTTRPSDHASIEVARAEQQLDRARGNYDTAKIAKAKERLDKAHADRKKISDEQSAASTAWQAKRDSLQQAAFTKLVHDRGLEL